MSTLAFCLLLMLVYTYAGYPLLVALWSRLSPWAASSPGGEFEPTVSVCIAVHNGASYLDRKLQSLRSLDYPPHKLEILLYSDGSTDQTEDLARALAESDARLRLLSHRERLGKPTGLNRLRAAAQGEVLLMTDVRQVLAPGALRALLRPLADPNVGCVSGNLVLAGSSGASAYWRYEKFIRGAEARLGNLVGVSGSLYALRRSDFPALPADVLLDDLFVPMEIVRLRKRVLFSVDAEAYDQACDDEREFERKVRTLAGNYQLVSKLPWLLLPGKNPLWFQLVSHKLLRLLCPWALFGLLGCSLLLATAPEPSFAEHAWWLGIAVAQLAFYALALLGARAGRVGALARTFVVLNGAALLGLWRFLRRSQAVAW
jgi:cellulose synthase/poly-beta-1,6-N-acetylglucosamine synthase-like glycosyltransferase